MPAVQVAADDAKIVERDVGELRASGALANRPGVGGRCLEAIVDTDVATVGQFDPILFEADASRVRRPASRNQDVRTLEGSVAIR